MSSLSASSLSASSSAASYNPRIQRAAHRLAAGGVVAYPTEAVWGLGCDPNNPEAVGRILALKHRPWDKGLILVAADIAQFAPLVERLDKGLQAQLTDSWPGPVTWLVPAAGLVPEWIRGRFDSVALRVTDHPIAAALSRAFGGPIVSTSANPAGKPAARSALGVRRYFRNQLDDITPGLVGERTRPSEIRDLLSGDVLR